ncbi:MAG TPA: dTDP-4-dehydrorhamnose 3,5-epimerase [Salinivirga sp.]|uniref:dTDP-4-dehydrorhamnose 3,5-epimerase n=1 Tax=Salinivirga cyanobacteriivorans TaxID=1307839 RepID=A0A0S2HYA4_9BACT|nr:MULTISPECIES: dTDP-4-dehydrorhamnose 3,5-epimerase [Salinivirga]ALO15075.1 dTDP-4-dehydrorhamnose 3,5-epimerase [Salinivirga cyanobacteriivorans]HKK59073.1 dTDP-4-dehydrorhamnose 3,5-epimerase [Salinivirga sp.]
MKIIETPISDLLIIEPKIFGDERGYFYESYNKQAFEKQGLHYDFVQDNQAMSQRGVLRGLHYQHPPFAQSKLIRAIEGEINDVAVDLRKGSPTFGRWFSVKLTKENHKQLLVPKGFAHGYAVLSETALVQYKCDAYYHPEAEGGINPFDAELNIDWGITYDEARLSDKDKVHPAFNKCVNKFEFHA